jgi:hypothetical protein
MSTESDLLDIAAHLMKSFEARETALQRELRDLEARQAEVQTELKLAGNAKDRFGRYQPGSQGDFRCPYCWMKGEQQPPLYPLGGGTRDEDYFRCSECKEKIAVRISR